MPGLTTWSGSLHLSYRLFPETTPHLVAFLEAADGESWESVFRRMPFDRPRSGGGAADPRRYRDAKQLYETAGLVYQREGRVWLTDLGKAVKRFRPYLSESNRIILARHAALGLSACQLRNPTDAGQKYDPSVEVFPNRFIWAAVLELGLCISSDELNRAIFKIKNEEQLREAIDRIRKFRQTGELDALGPETITEKAKNDRIIPVVSVASFGWTLLMDKGESPIAGHYCVRPGYERLLEAAVAVSYPHKDFPDVETYMRQISEAACLPQDLR